MDALIFTILFKPSTVRWTLLFISSTTCLNSEKSAAFWVNKGYLSKWRISLFKSLIEQTE